MVSHYFTKDPVTPSKERTITYKINGSTYNLVTDTNVLAKNGIDQGTMILLKIIIQEINTGKVLDIGCGYGVIGLTLASLIPDIQVVCSDINLRAVNLTIRNARALELSKRVTSLQSNLYENIEGNFDYVVTNPPIRAGKKVLDEIYTGAYQRLNTGGSLYLVVRRKQGAESTVSRLKEIYSHVDVLNKDKGYWVIKATK
ncbi:MAG: methyltransferase [Bacilli bacterium]|nr:methyltransferase [Bacilli bacterium]